MKISWDPVNLTFAMSAPETNLRVFLSYAREDRAIAESLAKFITAKGWTAWWDRKILAGEKWDEAIETALAEAHVVLVLWSDHSISSSWVRAEAGEAADKGKILPVRLRNIKPPLAFRQIQCIDIFERPILNTEDSVLSVLEAIPHIANRDASVHPNPSKAVRESSSLPDTARITELYRELANGSDPETEWLNEAEIWETLYQYTGEEYANFAEVVSKAKEIGLIASS